jgi:hypothetical protein
VVQASRLEFKANVSEKLDLLGRYDRRKAAAILELSQLEAAKAAAVLTGRITNSQLNNVIADRCDSATEQ